MPVPYSDTQIPTCYATCSIGYQPSHTLPDKLQAIAAAGFDAIELSMPDIISYGKLLGGQQPDPSDYDSLVSIGKQVSALARSYRLRIIMLQPFGSFEGWPLGSSERQDAFDRARGWMRIMEAVGTDMLQIGSSDEPGVFAASFDDMARDLAELADIFAEKGFRIAYENWCWATRAPGWREVWEIVKIANRPNIGLCLDTFQSAGGEWADPTTESGVIESVPRSELLTRWSESLAELSAEVPPDKIYLLQISDSYKPEKPLKPEPNSHHGLRPRGRWSHEYRPLPFDGGYLPVKEFLGAVLDTGFRGWLSIEAFDQEGQKRVDTIDEYARKAMDALKRLLLQD